MKLEERTPKELKTSVARKRTIIDEIISILLRSNLNIITPISKYTKTFTAIVKKKHQGDYNDRSNPISWNPNAAEAIFPSGYPCRKFWAASGYCIQKLWSISGDCRLMFQWHIYKCYIGKNLESYVIVLERILNN